MVKAHINYFQGLLKHKYWVFIYSIKLGVPLWLAIFHDISKFHPVEWFGYVKNFYNPDGSKREVRDSTGAYDTNKQSDEFKVAWIHHQRNKHHWQAWCNIGDEGVVTPIAIPEKYIREMVADWCGAGISIQGKVNPISWYDDNWNNLVITIGTRIELEHILWDNLELFKDDLDKYMQKRIL